jgi:hypothetical protein
MSFLTGLQKTLKTHHVLALVGIVVLVFAIYQYSGRKATVADSFGPQDRRRDIGGVAGEYPGVPMPSGDMSQPTGGVAVPANPAGMNEEFAKVSGLSTSTYGLAPCPVSQMTDPADLLPKDVNSQWAQLNPAGGADFQNVNLLKAGYHIGIDTVGSSLRNANLQERSEPPNPTQPVSPWLNSTIEPDLMRAPLEIGGAR